jgi:uncharacterized protein YggE
MKLLLCLFCTLLSVNVLSGSDESPTILHVRGEVELKAKPDQVTIVLGVITQNKIAKRALSDDSRLIKKIMTALEQKGINSNEMETQHFGVQPMWSSRPKNFPSNKGWRSIITGYRVNNNLKIITGRLALVGELINVAISAGANQVQSIQFGLVNPKAYREKAIANAIANAKEDAQFVAKASALTIEGIKAIYLDNAIASVERVQATSFERSTLSAKTDSAPPIKPGNISVRASVSVEYKLSSN